MSGFRPDGIANAFSKKSGGQNRRYPKDRLCEVLSYNLGSGYESASVSVREIDTGKLLDVSIDPKTIERFKQGNWSPGEGVKWLGWQIDERMRQHVPPGQWIVIERAETVRNIHSKDAQNKDVTRSIVRANYIDRAPVPKASKTFRAIATISTYDGRVRQVQVWDRQAVDISNNARIEQIANDLEESSKQWEINQQQRAAAASGAGAGGTSAKTPLMARLGVAFRTLIPDGVDAENKTKYKMIDSTPPFEWQAGQGEGDKGKPLDKAKFVELLKGYGDYVDQQFPEGNKDYEGLVIEIMPYRSFQASKMSRKLSVPQSSGAPLHRLANTPTKYSLTDTDFTREKNWAVDGIVVLSDDASDTQNRQFIDQNYVQALYANGYMANLHALVRQSDGARVAPHPDLDRPFVPQGPGNTAPGNTASGAAVPGNTASGNATQGSSGSVSSPVSAPSAGLAAAQNDPFAEDAAGADPFAGGGGEPSVYDRVLSGQPAPDPSVSSAAPVSAAQAAAQAPSGSRRTRAIG